MGKLSGKVAVVTGGGTGIGKGIAGSLAGHGAAVYIASHGRDTGEEAAASIREQGGKAEWVYADVSRADSVQAFMNHIADKEGRLDHLCNNAGVELFKSLEDTSEEEFDFVVGTDLKGVFLMCKYALPLLRRSGKASIVNISSVHAASTIPGISAYAAAKGGVNAMTRSFAQELGPQGIRVNSVCPGFIATPIWDRFLAAQPEPDRVDRETKQLHAVGRIGLPQDVAEMVAYLASDDAGFVTGSTLFVDGGLTSRLY